MMSCVVLNRVGLGFTHEQLKGGGGVGLGVSLRDGDEVEAGGQVGGYGEGKVRCVYLR